MAKDPTANGNLFVAGRAVAASGLHWLLRESLYDADTWSTVDPVVVNGANTVTNPILCTQQFYRLSQ